MATVYAAPTDLGDPPGFSQFRDGNGRLDFQAHRAAEDAWVATISAAARAANPRCDIAGEIVTFPIADGAAMYVIWNTKTLIHCPVGDAWQIPDAHARGLRAADLRDLVNRRKRMAELFGGRT
jgi:hypothetical protein